MKRTILLMLTAVVPILLLCLAVPCSAQGPDCYPDAETQEESPDALETYLRTLSLEDLQYINRVVQRVLAEKECGNVGNVNDRRVVAPPQDGTSIETAVVITAPDTMTGIARENEWISAKFGPRNVGWRKDGQALLEHNGRPYDEIKVTLANGTRCSFFFDIEGFFGKELFRSE